MFVIDASAALAWVFDDESTEPALRLLERLHRTRAIVPPIFWPEVANALLAAARRRRLRASPTQVLERLRRLPITMDAESSAGTVAMAIELAEKHGLSVYDATYLELAGRTGLPLATLAAALGEAAAKENPGVADRLRDPISSPPQMLVD